MTKNDENNKLLYNMLLNMEIKNRGAIRKNKTLMINLVDIYIIKIKQWEYRFY